MNQKINCVIIDDEPGNLVTLTEMLREYCPDIEVQETASDIESAFTIIRNNKPELVFLDIEMPYGNGFDLLDRLSPISFEIIFVTAFNDYAVKAFKYAALDYILKPVNIEELKQAVIRATARLKEKDINSRISIMLENLRPGNKDIQKIGLPTMDGILFEDISNIIRLQAEGSYTMVVIHKKQNILVSKNLKEFEDLLPSSFFCRIHHSHIINMNYLKKYYKGRGGYVELSDGTMIEVSVRKKDDFFEKFRH